VISSDAVAGVKAACAFYAAKMCPSKIVDTASTILEGGIFLDINQRLARQLSKLRLERRLSIEELSHRSGVSRAMISRIERAESSPTVNVLNNIAAGLGVLLPEVFGPSSYRVPGLRLRNPVATRASQPEWVDSLTGCRRRTLTPSTARTSTQLFEVVVPPAARLLIDNAGSAAIQRQIWVLRGKLEIHVGDESTRLAAGDCMVLAGEGVVTLCNAGDANARYVQVATASV
jgi:transcriptional regulator with XRE-family HTH domain